MIKKISFLIISLAIIIIGINAFNKLNFWERSYRIFKYNSSQFTGGRGFGGRPGFNRNYNFENRRQGFERPGIRNLTDSMNQRGFSEPGFRSQQDSLNTSSTGSVTGVRNNFRQGGFDRNGRPGGNFRRGKNIQLRNVYQFLAVFAAFTTITIFIDKGILRIRRKKKIVR